MKHSLGIVLVSASQEPVGRGVLCAVGIASQVLTHAAEV